MAVACKISRSMTNLHAPHGSIAETAWAIVRVLVCRTITEKTRCWAKRRPPKSTTFLQAELHYSLTKHPTTQPFFTHILSISLRSLIVTILDNYQSFIESTPQLSTKKGKQKSHLFLDFLNTHRIVLTCGHVFVSQDLRKNLPLWIPMPVQF